MLTNWFTFLLYKFLKVGGCRGGRRSEVGCQGGEWLQGTKERVGQAGAGGAQARVAHLRTRSQHDLSKDPCPLASPLLLLEVACILPAWSHGADHTPTPTPRPRLCGELCGARGGSGRAGVWTRTQVSVADPLARSPGWRGRPTGASCPGAGQAAEGPGLPVTPAVDRTWPPGLCRPPQETSLEARGHLRVRWGLMWAPAGSVPGCAVGHLYSRNWAIWTRVSVAWLVLPPGLWRRMAQQVATGVGRGALWLLRGRGRAGAGSRGCFIAVDLGSGRPS